MDEVQQLTPLGQAAASITPQLLARGYEPGWFQATFRGFYDGKWTHPVVLPKNPTSSDTVLAVLDALVNIGGVPAWNGDGVCCVAQMLDEVYADRARLLKENEELKERLAQKEQTND